MSRECSALVPAMRASTTRRHAGVRASTPSTVVIKPTTISFSRVAGVTEYYWFLLPLAYITVYASGELTMNGNVSLTQNLQYRYYGYITNFGMLSGNYPPNMSRDKPSFNWVTQCNGGYTMPFSFPAGFMYPPGQYTLAALYNTGWGTSLDWQLPDSLYTGGSVSLLAWSVLIRDGGMTPGSVISLNNLWNANPNVTFFDDNRYACGSYPWTAGAAFNLGTITAASSVADVSVGFHLETGGGGDTDMAYTSLVLVDVDKFVAAGGVLPSPPPEPDYYGENYTTLDIKWETPGPANYTWYSNPTKIYNALRAPGVVVYGTLPLSSVASSTTKCCNTETCFTGMMTQPPNPPNFIVRDRSYGYTADRSYYVVGRDAKVNVILSAAKLPLVAGRKYAAIAYLALGIDDRVSMKPMRAGQVYSNNYNGANEAVGNQFVFYAPA